MMVRILLFSLLICSLPALAQVEPTIQEGQFTFDTDKPFTLLELDQNDEPIVTKKKKPKRKFITESKPRRHLPARAMVIK
jgi:hypothetical protein